MVLNISNWMTKMMTQRRNIKLTEVKIRATVAVAKVKTAKVTIVKVQANLNMVKIKPIPDSPINVHISNDLRLAINSKKQLLNQEGEDLRRIQM